MKFPLKIDPRSPTAIFDADGQKVAATKEGHGFHPIDDEIAEANAVLIVGMSQEIERLRRCIQSAAGCLSVSSENVDERLAWYRLLDAMEGREPRVSISSTSNQQSEPWSMEKALTDEDAKRVNALLAPHNRQTEAE